MFGLFRSRFPPTREVQVWLPPFTDMSSHSSMSMKPNRAWMRVCRPLGGREAALDLMLVIGRKDIDPPHVCFSGGPLYFHSSDVLLAGRLGSNDGRK